MVRMALTDAQWAKMEPHRLGKPADPGRTGGDNRLFLEAVSDDSDMEYAMVDATIVPAHRHGHGAKGGAQDQAIGRSKAAGRPRSLH
jgi:hypothetical protein